MTRGIKILANIAELYDLQRSFAPCTLGILVNGLRGLQTNPLGQGELCWGRDAAFAKRFSSVYLFPLSSGKKYGLSGLRSDLSISILFSTLPIIS